MLNLLNPKITKSNKHRFMIHIVLMILQCWIITSCHALKNAMILRKVSDHGCSQLPFLYSMWIAMRSGGFLLPSPPFVEFSFPSLRTVANQGQFCLAYYLTHSWEEKRQIHTLPNDICVKVKATTLEGTWIVLIDPRRWPIRYPHIYMLIIVNAHLGSVPKSTKLNLFRLIYYLKVLLLSFNHYH